MTVTRRTVRDGVILHHVAETDLEGDAAIADLNKIDTGSIGILHGLISAAENIIIKLSNEPKANRRLSAARHAKRFAIAAINYVESGDAESATFNALCAAHNAWIMDVKGAEKNIVVGAASAGGAAKGLLVRRANAQIRKTSMQEKANRFWKINGNLSERDVATKIAKELPEMIGKSPTEIKRKADGIRKVIHKPKE